MDLSVFAHADAWIALLTLTAMEIVLGIDNIVFLSLVSNKLPPGQRRRARTVGLLLAMGMRVALLFSISWLMGLTDDIFRVFDQGISGRDLILGGGGLFLLGKASHEIFSETEAASEDGETRAPTSFAVAILQIVLLDIVFSLDSVITAIGMAEHLIIMVIAVVIAIFIMLIFAEAISRFIYQHPSMRILALSFLLMIGVMLVAESFDQHLNKGYIYFAMAFSLTVELLNIRVRGKRRVQEPMTPETAGQ